MILLQILAGPLLAALLACIFPAHRLGLLVGAGLGALLSLLAMLAWQASWRTSDSRRFLLALILPMAIRMGGLGLIGLVLAILRPAWSISALATLAACLLLGVIASVHPSRSQG